MSSVATAPGAAEPHRPPADVRTRGRRLGSIGAVLFGTGLAGGLVLLAFLTTGGTDLAPNTWVQIAMLAIAAALIVAVVAVGAAGRWWGGATLWLFAGLVALTFASIAWSVQPANSWLEASRTLSYFAAFAAAMTLARLFPGRWPAVAGGVAAFATVVCAWALLVKVFPASLDAADQLGRLRAPFDYYNATGMAAAMGLPGCLWAGARREGGPVLRALSIPAIAVLLTVLILSQSRGALLGAVIGVALWIALAPVRLRAVLVLAIGAAGATGVTLWAIGQRALTHDYSPLGARTVAGHHLGVALLVMLIVIAVVGFATVVAMDRVDVSASVRRRTGTALVALLALVPVVAVVALSLSSRGLTGQVSHAWANLTDQRGVVFNTPGRLADLASSRPRYWSEGLKVGERALVLGTGAVGYGTARARYTSDPLIVKHAHSYVIETFADFGLVGVALSLALLIAWLLAVRRVLPRTRGAPELDAERGGLLALLSIALVFGVDSLIDWTWFIPGVAVPAMMCAGWLAGRGPLAQPVGLAMPRRRLLDAPARVAAVLGVLTLVAVTGWIIWQPLRSANADAAAGSAMLRGDAGTAIADARTAAASNPVSVDPLWELSVFYTSLGDLGAAHRQLVDATSRQPDNPATWEQLAQFDLQHHRPAEAVQALGRAQALDPNSNQVRQLLQQR